MSADETTPTRCNRALPIDGNLYRCKHAEGHTGPHETDDQYGGTTWLSEPIEPLTPSDDVAKLTRRTGSDRG